MRGFARWRWGSHWQAWPRLVKSFSTCFQPNSIPESSVDPFYLTLVLLLGLRPSLTAVEFTAAVQVSQWGTKSGASRFDVFRPRVIECR